MTAKSTIPWKLSAYRSFLGAVPIRSPYSIVKSPTMTTSDHERIARTLGDRLGSESMDTVMTETRMSTITVESKMRPGVVSFL